MTVKSVLKSRGLYGLLLSISRYVFAPKAKSFDICQNLLAQQIGMEIGGPSSIFRDRGLLPLYPLVKRVDNCNFASTTVWQEQTEEGMTYKFDKLKPPGRQYIAEATNLGLISSSTYDFILSSHTLEHTANPMGALYEWKRVLKENGTLVLVVPHKEWTFDHRRPVTTLAHLFDDWAKCTTELDLTHLPEILALHDLARDSGAVDQESFRIRSENNLENRCLHHHVFDIALAIDLIDYIGMKILSVEFIRPFHIILIAQKLRLNEQLQNDEFKGTSSATFVART